MNLIAAYSIHFLVTVGCIGALTYACRPQTEASLRRTVLVMAPVAALFCLAQMSVPNAANTFNDFTLAYFPAGQAVLQGKEELAAVLAGGKFVNLPVIAWLFAPFAVVSEHNAAILFTFVGIAAAVAGWSALVKVADLNARNAAILALLFAANGPIFYSIKMGNTSHIVLLFLVLTMLLLRTEKQFLAGMILGFAGAIKLPLLLLPAYFALRGRWRVAIGSGVTIGSILLLSIVLFDWQMLMQWYEKCVAPFAKHPMPAYNVQSIHAAVLRIGSDISSLHLWEPQPMPRGAEIAAKGLVLALLATGVVTVTRNRWWPVRKDSVAHQYMADELEFLMVLVIALVISPLSWVHYYCWLLIPAALLVERKHHLRGDRISVAMGWLGLAIASQPVVIPYFGNPAWREAFFRGPQSHFLVGAILILGALVRARWITPLQDSSVDLQTPVAKLHSPLQ